MLPETMSLPEFLDAPRADVRPLVPATVIFTPGGTRRHAALNGIEPHSEEYARWSRARMMGCVELLFAYGVRNVFLTAMWPRQYAEVGPYREKAARWLAWGLAGAEAQADYARIGCRARLVGEGDPELEELRDRLGVCGDQRSERTIWWSFSARAGDAWGRILRAASEQGARTQADVLRALYGEGVPPAGIWLSFGKPMISADLIPLALLGETQCYWSQRPGYDLDEPTLRRIVYDYAFTRRTWSRDKTARADDVREHAGVWSGAGVLGVGRRVGRYWFAAAE